MGFALALGHPNSDFGGVFRSSWLHLRRHTNRKSHNDPSEKVAFTVDALIVISCFTFVTGCEHNYTGNRKDRPSLTAERRPFSRGNHWQTAFFLSAPKSKQP